MMWLLYQIEYKACIRFVRLVFVFLLLLRYIIFSRLYQRETSANNWFVLNLLMMVRVQWLFLCACYECHLNNIKTDELIDFVLKVEALFEKINLTECVCIFVLFSRGLWIDQPVRFRVSFLFISVLSLELFSCMFIVSFF